MIHCLVLFSEPLVMAAMNNPGKGCSLAGHFPLFVHRPHL
jgi:hypothetical protein